MRILSDDWEVMLGALFRRPQRRRHIWSRWQVDARRLIDGDGPRAYYSAARSRKQAIV